MNLSLSSLKAPMSKGNKYFYKVESASSLFTSSRGVGKEPIKDFLIDLESDGPKNSLNKSH
jgi:hypothetical protein